MTSIWYLTSRFDVGSSRIRISGSWTRPRAIRTLWSCPALSSRMSLSEYSSNPRRRIVSSTTSISFSEVVHPALGCLPMRIASATLMEKTLVEEFGTKAMILASSGRLSV